MKKGWSGSPRHTDTYGPGPVEGAPVIAAAKPGKFAMKVAPDAMGFSGRGPKGGKMPTMKGGIGRKR